MCMHEHTYKYCLNNIITSGLAVCIAHFTRIITRESNFAIQLLESPIPTTPATLSQKASSGNISGTKRGIMDPLVSKRPKKILNKKIQKKNHKQIKKNMKK